MNSFEIYQYLPIYYALNKDGYGAKKFKRVLL